MMVGKPNIRDLLRRRSGEDPEAVCLLQPDGTVWSFARMQETASEVGAALANGGPRIGVRMANTPRSLAALHACWQTGRAAVLLGSALPPNEVDRRAAETGCRLIHDPETAATRGVRDSATTLVGDGEAVLIFTSGTTGRPKAAVLGFGSLEASLRSIAEAVEMPEGRRPTQPARSPSPTFLPLAHVGGFLSAVTAMYLGKPSLLVDRWRPEEVFDLVARFGLTLLRLTPAMVHDLANAPGDRNLDGVRTISVGSAALSEDVRRAVEDRYGVAVLNNYGQTETAGAIAFERYEDVVAGRRPPGSVGRVAPGVGVRIVVGGQDVPVGEVGEIWALSDGALDAYVVHGARLDPREEGWVATGDLGHLDDEGFLYLVGRVDDVIHCGGFNLYPAMIEAALRRLPGIDDAAVIGLPDDRLGAVPIAAVVGGRSADAAGLRRALRDELAAYELPRRIVCVDRIPRNEMGKTDRWALRALVQTRADDEAP